jgi:hypothetical protein
MDNKRATNHKHRSWGPRTHCLSTQPARNADTAGCIPNFRYKLDMSPDQCISWAISLSLVVQYIKSFYKILGGILVIYQEDLIGIYYLLQTCENGTIAMQLW